MKARLFEEGVVCAAAAAELSVVNALEITVDVGERTRSQHKVELRGKVIDIAITNHRRRQARSAVRARSIIDSDMPTQ